MEKPFEAEAQSFLELMTMGGTVVGFRVPEYQRRYEWDARNVRRLFEDVLSSITSLQSQTDQVCFLGTVILVKEEHAEADFNGTSYSIVDGQQRLTTLVLIAMNLVERMQKLTREIPDGHWTVEAGEVQGNLEECLSGEFPGRARQRGAEPFPRIVRQSLDARGRTNVEYRSHVAYLIDQFRRFLEGTGDTFNFVPRYLDGDYEILQRNIKAIDECLEAIQSGKEIEEDDLTLAAIRLSELPRKGYAQLFETIPVEDRNRTLHQLQQDDPKVQEMARLLTFANFAVHRVHLTVVVAKEERYAFDIFDALNTTGEPLTAFETLLPRFVRVENELGAGYAGSETKVLLDEADGFIAGERQA